MASVSMMAWRSAQRVPSVSASKTSLWIIRPQSSARRLGPWETTKSRLTWGPGVGWVDGGWEKVTSVDAKLDDSIPVPSSLHGALGDIYHDASKNIDAFTRVQLA